MSNRSTPRRISSNCSLEVEVFRFVVPKFGILLIEVVRGVLERGVLSQ
jgi:hypothetical protein